MDNDGRRIAVQEIPEEMIASMSYENRRKLFEQELHERLQKMGRLPLWKYDKMIKELVAKYKV